MTFFSNRRQADDDLPDDVPVSADMDVPQQPIGFETVLGASTVIEGNLISKGNVRLDGEFTGTLDITGNVLVGETAKIHADLDARNISIAGAVRGNITGNKVQLLRTGRIWGDIRANALTTEEGAFIDGKITMRGHEAHIDYPTEEFPSAATAIDIDEVIETPVINETDETDEPPTETNA